MVHKVVECSIIGRRLVFILVGLNRSNDADMSNVIIGLILCLLCDKVLIKC